MLKRRRREVDGRAMERVESREEASGGRSRFASELAAEALLFRL